MSHRTTAYAACAVALSSTGNVIQLLPAGTFRAKDGRPDDVDAWTLDAHSAGVLIAGSSVQGRLVIDYEHQSLNTQANGQPAPAAGWFSRMEWREGEGLFALDVEWTDKASQMIKAGEYRYLSPVIGYDRSTGAVTKLVSAGLTNSPALDGMEEVTALSATPASVRADASAPEDVAELLRISRELTESLKSKAEEVKETRSELTALRNRIDSERLEALIDEALSEARLLPVHVDAARKLGQTDFASLKALLDRPPIVPALLGMQSERLRALGHEPGSTDQAAGLSAEELHVCALAGRTPKEFAALKRRFVDEQTGHTD
jgi:phage I-like protein